MATAPVVLEQQPGAATSPIAPAVAAIKTTLGDLINDVLTVPPAGNPAAEATDGAAAAEEPYYWEAGVENPPPAVLVTHNLHWAGMQLVAGMEYIGEVFSEFFGLTNSRYEWAVQAQRNMQAEMEAEEQRQEQQKRWAMLKRMKEEETGAATAAAAAGEGASAPVVPAPAEPAAAPAPAPAAEETTAEQVAVAAPEAPTGENAA